MTIINTRDLKLKMGRAVEGEDPNEEKLQQVVEHVDSIIHHITGTFFAQTTIEDEIIDCYAISENKFKMAEDRQSIWCPAPIITISSFTENDIAQTENTDYYLYKTIGRIDADGVFSSERRIIKLTGSFGYATIPTDIKEMSLLIGQILTGLATTAILDEDGELSSVIRHNVPAWVWKHLKSRRWTY